MRTTPIAIAAILLAHLAFAQPTPPAADANPPATPAPPAPPLPPGADPAAAALQASLRNFPPLILGGNVQPSQAGAMVPPSCPQAGARLEQKGGPTIEYLGPSPGDPDLCLMKIGDHAFEAWYAIWSTAEPGAEYAHRALQRLLHSRTADVVGFDTLKSPEAQWHDLIRLDGIEDIVLLDKSYKAVKLAHYHEGFGGNPDRSLTTLWKDLATGLIIYRTYQHIAGKPDLDAPLIPTAILPAP